MNREILFRGFAPDENGTEKVFINGEWIKGKWVEGDLLHDKVGIFICIEDENGYNEYKVIPETVGQYTGLTDDKNDKKIFEGDIVELYVKGCRTICTVSWAETVAHFQLWQINTVPGTPTALNLGNYDCEVIGNIHSNPELLKGGAE